MKVSAISGFGAKGPAAFLVEAGGRRILLDLGEGPEPGVRPEPERIGPLDAIVLSHAHADHVGALDLAPMLGGPDIWCTAVVAELAGAQAFGRVRELPASGEAEVAGLAVVTGRAGHAPGAVWVRIGGEAGLLYTGDTSREGILYAADPLPPAAGLIFDASYGDYDDPLAEGVERIVACAAAGPVLLPAPAGGRGLEMAAILHERGLRVSLCPVHRRVAEILLARPGVLSQPAAMRLAAALEAAAPLTGESAPDGAMIAAAPDAGGGVAQALASRWAGDGRVRILFTGHLAAGTPARTLVQAGDAQMIRWNVHPRLSDLAAMLAETRAAQVLPAFLPADRIAPLAAALGIEAAGPDFSLPG